MLEPKIFTWFSVSSSEFHCIFLMLSHISEKYPLPHMPRQSRLEMDASTGPDSVMRRSQITCYVTAFFKCIFDNGDEHLKYYRKNATMNGKKVSSSTEVTKDATGFIPALLHMSFDNISSWTFICNLRANH